MELVICLFIIIVIIFLLRKEAMTNKNLYTQEELMELGLFDLEQKKKKKNRKKQPFEESDVIQRLRKAKKIILK